MQIVIGYVERPGGRDFNWYCPICEGSFVTYVPEGNMIIETLAFDANDPCGGQIFIHERNQIEEELESIRRNPLVVAQIRGSMRLDPPKNSGWWG